MTGLVAISYPHPLSLSLFPSQTHSQFETPRLEPGLPSFPVSPLIADLYASCDLGGYKALHIILDHSSAPREASYEERSLNDAPTINSVLCPNVALILPTSWSNIDIKCSFSNTVLVQIQAQTCLIITVR